MTNINFEDFKKIEIRVGTITKVEDFPEAIKPAYKLQIDLGKKIGFKHSSAQITDLYTKNNLIGRQVLVVTNLFPKKVGPFTSECLVTGFYTNNMEVVLASPEKRISNGSLLV